MATTTTKYATPTFPSVLMDASAYRYRPRAGTDFGPRRGVTRRRVWRRKRRAVSEVIATILLLGMTVTLFSAVFILVNRFPTPQPQAQTQFETTLATKVSGNATTVIGINITHGTGPTVPLSARIYLQCSNSADANWQFTRSGGIPMSWGLSTNGTGQAWGAGEVWSTSFKPALTLPVTLTVTVVATSVVLYQAIVPGGSFTVPPLVVATGTTPTPVQQNSTFQIYAVLSGDGANSNTTSVTVLLSALSGVSGSGYNTTTHSCALSWSRASGNWVTSPIKTSTKPGTYTGFIYGQNSAGQKFSGSVSIEIVG